MGSLLLWAAVWLLAVSFLSGFAFLDSIFLAMRRQDNVDYEWYYQRGLPEPTLSSLLPVTAISQTAIVLLALWACLQRVNMGWPGTLIGGAFVVGTILTVGLVVLAPKKPHLQIHVSSACAALMAGATWLVAASSWKAR